MNLEFAKLNGLGNDFIMINNFDGNIALTSEQVSHLCDRHFGIGADGVILVEAPKDDDSDAYMHYINSDGTLAQMCGNGVRCFAKFLVDRKLVNTKNGSLIAGTMAGNKNISFTIENDLLVNAKVDMGKPILEPSEIPTTLKANADLANGGVFVCDQPIANPWGPFKFSVVSMGNPHAICFVDDWSAFPSEIFTSNDKGLQTLNLDIVGPYFESNAVFPEKSNIEFAQICPDHIEMRVYERGCGETLACGTGACATSVAATLTERAQRANEIQLLGGSLFIDWQENDHVIMTGPAKQSFIGSVNID